MQKNLLAVVAIALGVVAISVSWQRKHIEVSSITLKDVAGNVFALIDAEHRRFEIYNPNGVSVVSIEATREGASVIVGDKDGFEGIHLSTWMSEGNHIHILRDGWQNDPGGAPPSLRCKLIRMV